MRLVIAIMVLILMFTMPVSAGENGLLAQYDDSVDRVIVSGDAVKAAVYGNLVSLTVYYDADESETFTPDDILQYITTISDEEVEDDCYSFKLINNADRTQEVRSGFYIVRLSTSDSNDIDESVFYYMSKSDRDACLRNINTASTTAELDTIITTNNKLFDVNMTEYASIDKAYVLSAVLSGKPYSSIQEFVSKLEEAMGCYYLKAAKSAEDVEETISKYGTYFKLDTTDMYAEFVLLDEQGKTDVYTQLIGKEYTSSSDVIKEFDTAVVLSLINNANQWSEIKRVLGEYAENLSIDLKYFNMCNTADLAVELAKALPYNTKTELYDAIKAYAEALSDKPSGSGGSGGGGGGSSGGGGGGSSSGGNGKYSYSAEVDIPEEENVTVVTPNDELKNYEWARASIEGLMAMGAVKGNENGLFMPGNQITREEFLKILVEAFGLYESGKECDFNDVPKSNWAYSYIACAVDKGVVKGIGENRFGLGQKITRQDMAVMIERATGIAGISLVEKNGKNFVDANTISDYARGSVEKLAKSGVINGYDDGRFKPLNLVIRAEAAVMIHNVVRGE